LITEDLLSVEKMYVGKMHVIGEMSGAEPAADCVLGGDSGLEQLRGVSKLRLCHPPALTGANEQPMASVRLDRCARDVAGVAELSVGKPQRARADIGGVADDESLALEAGFFEQEVSKLVALQFR
jgi:hypothetical protein